MQLLHGQVSAYSSQFVKLAHRSEICLLKWVQSLIQVLFANALLYSALSICHGQFSWSSSRKTSHISPVMARYGMSFMSAKSDRSLTFVWQLLCCAHYHAIYDRNVLRVYSIQFCIIVDHVIVMPDWNRLRNHHSGAVRKKSFLAAMHF